MKQKHLKIIYWGTHIIFAGMMALSAVMYITKPEVAEGFKHLGYPSYFRVELAIFKLLGALVLILPVWSRLKEWAYSGFGITLVSAFIAHLAVADSIDKIMAPIIMGGIFVVAYLTHCKLGYGFKS